MYLYDICNNFIEFDTFDYLIKSQVDANMKFWQIYGKFKPAITSTYLNLGEICDIL